MQQRVSDTENYPLEIFMIIAWAISIMHGKDIQHIHGVQYMHSGKILTLRITIV
jgi:hypothetical protein